MDETSSGTSIIKPCIAHPPRKQFTL